MADKQDYRLSDLEEKLLRMFYARTRKTGRKKETPTGLAQDARRENKDVERGDIEEAIDILIAQKYLDKKTESHRFDPKVYNRFSTDKPHTVKTTYVTLSGKALLYLTNRVPSSDGSQPVQKVYDAQSPYKTRRELENVFEEAKSLICIADNYVGRKTLDYLMVGSAPVRIITSSNKEKNFDAAFEDFSKEYPSAVEIRVADGKLHGRFVLADDKCYVLDHSIKDFGAKPSTIIQIEDATVAATFRKLFEDNWGN